MKTVIDAVNQFKGKIDKALVLESVTTENYWHKGRVFSHDKNHDTYNFREVCTREEFNQCVDELSKAEWMKPVMSKGIYTQEFRVLGGANEVWQKCKIVFVGKRYTVVENENGKEFSRKTAKIFIRDITPPITLIDGKAYQFDVDDYSACGIYEKVNDSLYTVASITKVDDCTNIKLLEVKD